MKSIATIIKEKKINIFVNYAILFFAFAASIRLFGTGADFNQYIRIFSDTSISVEPAFALFRTIAIHLGGANFVFFCFGILSLSFIYQTINEYSEYPSVTFIFYLLSFYLLHVYIQIRAATAISIFFLSINDLRDRNFKSYFIKTIVATSFHYSSLFMLVLYVFCKINKLRKFVSIPLFLFLFDFIFIYFLENKFNVAIILDWLAERQNNPIFSLVRMKISYRGETLTLFNIQYLSFLVVLFAMYFTCIKNKKITKNELVIFKIFSFSLCCFFSILPTGLNVLVFRIPEFYLPVVVIALSMIIKHIKEKKIALIIVISYVLLLFAMFISKIGVL